MKNLNLIIILFIGALFFSCSENEEHKIVLTDTTELILDSKLADPNYTGTICTVKRNTDLVLGEIIEYEYVTNRTNPTVTWEVVSGDIEIISGVNSLKVEIKLGPEFTRGVIGVDGYGYHENNILLRCDAQVVITRE